MDDGQRPGGAALFGYVLLAVAVLLAGAVWWVLPGMVEAERPPAAELTRPSAATAATAKSANR